MSLQIRSYPNMLFVRTVPLGVPTDLVRTREVARMMAAKAFDNTDEFPYVYITNGVTEAIDWVLPRHKVDVHARDYRYAQYYRSKGEHNLAYRSYPFAGDGSWRTPSTDLKVFLDCAYIFASDMTNVRTIPANVQYAAFSLSKSHNLAHARIGFLLSKEKIQPQHTLQYDYGYGPSHHLEPLLAAVQEVPNLLYKHYDVEFRNAYSELGLMAYDTNLFALTLGGIRVPWYTAYERLGKATFSG